MAHWVRITSRASQKAVQSIGGKTVITFATVVGVPATTSTIIDGSAVRNLAKMLTIGMLVEVTEDERKLWPDGQPPFRCQHCGGYCDAEADFDVHVKQGHAADRALLQADIDQKKAAVKGLEEAIAGAQAADKELKVQEKGLAAAEKALAEFDAPAETTVGAK